MGLGSQLSAIDLGDIKSIIEMRGSFALYGSKCWYDVAGADR